MDARFRPIADPRFALSNVSAKADISIVRADFDISNLNETEA